MIDRARVTRTFDPPAVRLAWPETFSARMFYVGEVEAIGAALPKPGGEKKLLVFCPNLDKLPGLYLSKSANDESFVGLVTLPILNGLTVNPKNQAELTRIFFQLLGHEPQPTTQDQP